VNRTEGLGGRDDTVVIQRPVAALDLMEKLIRQSRKIGRLGKLSGQASLQKRWPQP